MPVVPCPSCAAALNLGANLYGKSVKCPKCSMVFMVPSPEATLTPPSEAVSPGTPAATPMPPDASKPWRPAGDPLGYDEPSDRRPRRSRDYDDDPPRRRSRRDDFDLRRYDSPWLNCRNGARLAMIGAAILFPTILCMAATHSIMTAVIGTPGDNAFDRLDRPAAGGFGLAFCGLIVILLGAAIVHFVGQVMCCWTPSPLNQKAVRFVIAFGVTVGIGILTVCVMFAITVSQIPRFGPDREQNLLYGVAFRLVVGSCAVVATCFWLAYQSDVARHFHDDSLAGQCNGLMIGYVVYYLAHLIAASLVATIRPMRSMQPIVEIASWWIAVGLFGWYLFSMVRLNALVAKTVDEQ